MNFKKMYKDLFVPDPNLVGFTNLKYLDYLVVKLGLKSIFSFVGLFLFIVLVGFADRLIPEQLRSTLFIVNISLVSLFLVFSLSYNAFENLRFYHSLRHAQKTYKRAIADEDGPTEASVNDYMQLGLDRYGETLEFKESNKLKSLETIQEIDKKLKEFEFNESEDFTTIIRINLDVAMRSLYDGFDIKSVFTMPKRLYYRKWALAKLKFEWMESKLDSDFDSRL